MIDEMLTPWTTIDEQRRSALEAELRRELPPDHPIDFDGEGCAVVHLTWSGRRESSPWPATQMFSSIDDWRQRRMVPDHEELTADV